MGNLKSLFTEEKNSRQISRDSWTEKLKATWDRQYKGAEEIMKRINFLKEEGYEVTYDNFHSFSRTKADKSYYPCIRVNSTIVISPIGDGTEEIKVKSVSHFSLIGEYHTYESFIKKLVRR